MLLWELWPLPFITPFWWPLSMVWRSHQQRPVSPALAQALWSHLSDSGHLLFLTGRGRSHQGRVLCPLLFLAP